MTNSKYDLELSKVIDKIKQTNAKNVCIQLPDGLKPYAKEIKEAIDKEFNFATKNNNEKEKEEIKNKGKESVSVFIWAGSCFGACDVPSGLDKLGIDLLIQWGHSEWR